MSLALPELIARHRRDRTLYQLWQDAGGGPGESAWHAWEHGTRLPKPENMTYIATALGIEPWEVLVATGVSVGIDPPTPASTPRVCDYVRTIPGAELLDDIDIAAVVSHVASYAHHHQF